MLEDKILDKLKTTPLNGAESQIKMAHTGRKFYPKDTDKPRLSAVLQLLYPRDNEWFFPLIIRSSRFENDVHKGQVGFPGGAVEKEDEDLSQTALRETLEEIGAHVPRKCVLRALTSLYIPVSGFEVHPFLAVYDKCPKFIRQESEVEEVLEIPLRLLLDPESKGKKSMKIQQRFVLDKVPYYDFFGHTVWGATAMMLGELEDLLLSSDFNYKISLSA